MHQERVDYIRSLRPSLDIQYDPSDASVEKVFQNEVLRPLLKFQNKLILNCFIEFCLTRKVSLDGLEDEKKRTLIKNALSKNQKLKYTMIGMISGLFSEEEHKYYLQHQKEINRRMFSMLVERIHSQF